jgi:hypothetical protein
VDERYRKGETVNRLIALAAALALTGCALPLISTDLDKTANVKHSRTGTHFSAKTALPRDWKETDLKYMGREETEDLVRRQKAMFGGG